MRWNPTRTVLALIPGAMLLTAACGGGSGSDDTPKNASRAGGGGSASAQDSNGMEHARRASRVRIAVSPGDGATGVDTRGALGITAADGKLVSVVVKNAGGDQVDGDISADGSGWRTDETLTTDTRYTVDTVAKDAEGRRAAKHTGFTTLKPKSTLTGYFTPESGQTVGVGMEVSLNFTRGITNRAAIEKAVKVSATPSLPVVGKWYGNDRLDFRPQRFWAPGTKITLSLRLDGVEGRPGVYGWQRKDVHFRVGRRQVSVVDSARHTMKVYRGGTLYRTMPITSGAPRTTTYNGTMVITEKYLRTRMNGQTVGFGDAYDIKDVPHAMRLTTSGTFIHGNYWAAPWVFGNSNVSHGCVGLRDVKGGGGGTPAEWFFNHSIVGDVVVVKNSRDRTVQWWNGLNGWNLPWSEWRRGTK